MRAIKSRRNCEWCDPKQGWYLLILPILYASDVANIDFYDFIQYISFILF